MRLSYETNRMCDVCFSVEDTTLAKGFDGIIKHSIIGGRDFELAGSELGRNNVGNMYIGSPLCFTIGLGRP